jgi:hypothetical protein
VGALLALVVFGWVVSLGLQPLAGEALGDFYDVQARALMDGHWDVAPDAVSFERFAVDGRYYTYFGPWPSLLRAPVLLVTDQLDGRLSRTSMVLAFAVYLAATVRVLWQVRSLLPARRPTRRELIAVAGFVFVAGCGSTALFLGSRAWVYHEAILWGVAWSVASFSFLLDYLARPTTRALTLTAVTATLAVLSRASVGAGPILALGAVLAVQLLQRAASARRRSGRSRDVDPRGPDDRATGIARRLGLEPAVLRRPLWPMVVAISIPVGLYAYVNFAKFGTPFGLPIDKQDLLLQHPERRAALEISGSLFSPRFAPTNLLQYLRPDAIAFDRLFPWVTFSRPPWQVGGVPFDNIEPSASVTAVSTVLVLLAVIGVVAVVRGPGRGAPAVGRLRVPLLAAAAATVGIILLGVHFQRYEGDFLPLLVVAAAAGLAWLPRVLAKLDGWPRAAARWGLVALAAWSCWATLSLTLQYQRLYSAFQRSDARIDFVDLQLDVGDALGTGGPSRVEQGPSLPDPVGAPFRGDSGAALGDYFIVGDCEALYVSSRKGWEQVEGRLDERTPTPLCDRIRSEADG